MAGDRTARALARIDAAASRIEAAASAPVAAPDRGELARKHETLRSEVAAVIADLDRVIGAFDR